MAAQTETPCIWLPQIAELIAERLPTNEIPMTLRLLDRATAALFSKARYKTIFLSRPCPQHAYGKSWCKPGSLRYKSWGPQAFELAVRCGDVLRCKWLASQFCHYNSESALKVAAEHGHMGVAEYLVIHHRVRPREACLVAASHGHAPLALWLLKRCEPHPNGKEELLVAAARGCVLQALVWLLARVDVEDLEVKAKARIIGAAESCRTPDARVKAQWLRAEFRL